MTTFSDRKHALYECLRLAEAQACFKIPALPSHVSSRKCNESIRRKMRHETKQFKGRKSMYSKTEEPLPRHLMNKNPQYQRNPHKWTYYNMEGVPDVTDQTNADAVAQCMKQIEMSKSKCADPIDVDTESKLTFRLPVKGIKQDEKQKPLYVNSKIILPEYIIGEKLKSRKCLKASKHAGCSNTNLRLDHLYEDDDT